MSWNELHVHYILESTFARIFLFLELINPSARALHLHQFAQFAYIVFAIFVFVRR